MTDEKRTLRNWPFDRQDVVLIGGFICRLTADERNAWTEHVRRTNEHADIVEAEAVYRALCERQRATATDLGVAGAHRELVRAEQALYAVAKAWYAANINLGQEGVSP